VFHFANRAKKPGIAAYSVPTESTAPSASAPRAELIPDLMRTPDLGLEFWQRNKECPIFTLDRASSKTRVVLEPGPFEIRSPRVKAAVQICAWIDDSIFAEIAPDKKVQDVPYFTPGTGMTDSTFSTAALRLEKRAHNYYDESRRRKISDEEDSIYVSSLVQEDKKLTQWPTLYLVVLVNRDQNDEIATDEFERIILEFAR